MVVAAVAAGSALFFSVALKLVWRARRSPVVSGQEAIIGAEVVALEDFDREGTVSLQGEHWQARSAQPLRQGQGAVVTAIDGLWLRVRGLTLQEQGNGTDHQ